MNSLVDKLYERVSFLLKVPAGSLNPNSEEVIRTFKPAARYAGYRLCRWFFTQLSIFIPYAALLLPREYFSILEQMGFGWIQNINYSGNFQEKLPEFMKLPVTIFTMGVFLTQFLFSFVFTFLSAKSQSYLLTDHSLRIRRGLWIHQQITLSLKNIQQVKFSQNLLERLWGIGSLEVRTAGGGVSSKKKQKDEDKSHTGQLEGLLDPIGLRELVNAKIKDASSVKSSLSASTAQPQVNVAESLPELEPAIQELLLACQSLRKDIASRSGEEA